MLRSEQMQLEYSPQIVELCYKTIVYVYSNIVKDLPRVLNSNLSCSVMRESSVLMKLIVISRCKVDLHSNIFLFTHDTQIQLLTSLCGMS